MDFHCAMTAMKARDLTVEGRDAAHALRLVGAHAWLIAIFIVAASKVVDAFQQELPHFTACSELVLLHVSVEDRSGRYVTGLPETAFTILDNSQPQPIKAFLADDSPATIGILFDSSGSMVTNRGGAAAAVAALVRTSKPNDESFALTFNDQVRSALPADEPFTNSPSRLANAVANSLRAGGRTALFDALAEGLAYLDRGRHQRKVLIVVGDGEDNASQKTFDDVFRQLQMSNAVMYIVGLVDPLVRNSHLKALERLAAVSGGEAFRPDTAAEMYQAFEHIAADIRHSYLLAFEPRQLGINRPHRIVVTVSNAAGGRLQAHTRASYFEGGQSRGCGDQ
jgi:VWFA-related protein